MAGGIKEARHVACHNLPTRYLVARDCAGSSAKKSWLFATSSIQDTPRIWAGVSMKGGSVAEADVMKVQHVSRLQATSIAGSPDSRGTTRRVGSASRLRSTESLNTVVGSSELGRIPG